MKKFSFVLALAILFTYSSVLFGATVEGIMKLGYPKDVSEKLAKSEPISTWEIPKWTVISAALWEREPNVKYNFPIKWDGDHKFEAEVRSSNGFILYRIVNEGREIIFRIGDLPIQKTVSETPVLTQTTPAPTKAATEQKPIAAVPLPATPFKKERLENVERPVEAYRLKGIGPEELKKAKATAIDFPILGTNWINDGIGKYYTFETESGEAVVRFMTRNLWRSIVADRTTGDFQILPAWKRRCDRVHIIYPNAGKDDLVGKHKYLVSGNGKKVLLADGRQIKGFDLEKFQEDENYRIEFLKKYPSQIKTEELLDISPSSKYGKEYVELLKEKFPKNLYVKGERVSFSSDLETLKKINGELSNAKYGHRALKNGALPSLTVMSVLFFPFELARMGLAALISIPDAPLNGSYEGGSFSGEEIGDTIDMCVAQILKDYEK